MNSLGIVYGKLGLAEKSEAYYEKGIELALPDNSASAYNFINTYSIILGKQVRGKERSLPCFIMY